MLPFELDTLKAAPKSFYCLTLSKIPSKKGDNCNIPNTREKWSV